MNGARGDGAGAVTGLAADEPFLHSEEPVDGAGLAWRDAGMGSASPPAGPAEPPRVGCSNACRAFASWAI
jgi:hypothetical protein